MSPCTTVVDDTSHTGRQIFSMPFHTKIPVTVKHGETICHIYVHWIFKRICCTNPGTLAKEAIEMNNSWFSHDIWLLGDVQLSLKEFFLAVTLARFSELSKLRFWSLGACAGAMPQWTWILFAGAREVGGEMGETWGRHGGEMGRSVSVVSCQW